MNDKLISMFKHVATYEEAMKHVFQSKAYLNAIDSLKTLTKEIETVDDVKDLYGFGKGILKKVEDFLSSGTFSKYEEYLNSDVPKYEGFTAIKGIGMSKAKSFWEAGYTSLKDLKEKTKSLKIGDKIPNTNFKFTVAIQSGLQYEAHTEKTRMTPKQHDEVANPILNDLSNYVNPDMISVAGSRRRWDGLDNEYTIGDIDFIIGIDVKTSGKTFYKKLEKYLDVVTMSGETKVSGIKNTRQIDFRIVDYKQFGSALLHSTGPKEFNIKLRKIANEKGMTLNEYGLFNLSTNECIASETEEDIFKKLNLEWIKPFKRKDF